jgi:hypothetical protein
MPEYRVLRRHTYGRRDLRPGDIYELTDETHAKILLDAKFIEASDLPPPKTARADADRASLQAQAEAAGVDVDKRWSEARLRQEIADAVGKRQRQAKDLEQSRKPDQLSRKDMQAESDEEGTLRRKAAESKPADAKSVSSHTTGTSHSGKK